MKTTMIKCAVLAAAATEAAALFGDGLAPLNPEFSKWRDEQASISPANGPVGGNEADGNVANPQLRVGGVIPSPFDRSYLKDFYVDGEAVSPLKPRQAGLLGAGNSAIPSAYDTRADGRGLTSVKNQSPYGTCWAHATCGCLEAWLLNVGKGTFDLSENNLVNLHGRDWSFSEGGNGDVASAYLLRWGGPVLESSDPYPNIGGSPTNLEPILHLQNVKWIPGRTSSTDNALIKKAVMKYGAVSVDYFHEPAAGGGVAKIDGNIVAVDPEKVAAMFEATSDLRDWDGAAKLTPEVEVLGTDANGKMTFAVTPGDGTAQSAFLRIMK